MPAEQSNVTDETIQKYQREYSLQKRKCEEETGVLRAILKRAKADGVNTKTVIAVHQAGKQELDVVVADLRDAIRYMALRNMPVTQMDLFGEGAEFLTEKAAREQDEFDADDAGYGAGMGGQTADDNPHPAGAALYVAWEGGRKKGAEAKGRILGSTGKQADGSRKRPERKAKTNADVAAEVQKARGRPRKAASALN